MSRAEGNLGAAGGCSAECDLSAGEVLCLESDYLVWVLFILFHTVYFDMRMVNFKWSWIQLYFVYAYASPIHALVSVYDCVWCVGCCLDDLHVVQSVKQCYHFGCFFKLPCCNIVNQQSRRFRVYQLAGTARTLGWWVIWAETVRLGAFLVLLLGGKCQILNLVKRYTDTFDNFLFL